MAAEVVVEQFLLSLELGDGVLVSLVRVPRRALERLGVGVVVVVDLLGGPHAVLRRFGVHGRPGACPVGVQHVVEFVEYVVHAVVHGRERRSYFPVLRAGRVPEHVEDDDVLEGLVGCTVFLAHGVRPHLRLEAVVDLDGGPVAVPRHDGGHLSRPHAHGDEPERHGVVEQVEFEFFPVVLQLSRVRLGLLAGGAVDDEGSLEDVLAEYVSAYAHGGVAGEQVEQLAPGVVRHGAFAVVAGHGHDRYGSRERVAQY